MASILTRPTSPLRAKMRFSVWVIVAALVLCAAAGLWAVTERVEFRYHWSNAEQLAYARGVKDAMAAMAHMMRQGVGPREQAGAMEKVAALEDEVLWLKFRERSEPLMAGSVRGVVLGEYHEALRAR